MILLTLGTHEQPFQRAVDLVAPMGERERVLVQHGHTPPRPAPGLDWVEFVERQRMRELVAKASAIVCHAGTGCIVTAISLGKMPVVIPRLARHGEHVDDHQLQITTEFGAAGLVVPCMEDGDIEAALDDARGRTPRLPGRGDLRQAVTEAARLPSRGRRRGHKLAVRPVVGAHGSRYTMRTMTTHEEGTHR